MWLGIYQLFGVTQYPADLPERINTFGVVLATVAASECPHPKLYFQIVSLQQIVGKVVF